MKTNVYIDGFNLYYGALKHRPTCKWLDMNNFARCLLLSGQTLHRTRYFTARVSATVDPQTPQRQQAFLRALGTLPQLSIHEGQFRTNRVRLPLVQPPVSGSRFVEVLRTEEKGSDVNLATYLLLDAFQQDAEVAVVVSDDFDLEEPLRIARTELQMTLGVASPRCQRWLADKVSANFYRPVRENTLLACQLPGSLSDSAGTIQRPSVWA